MNINTIIILATAAGMATLTACSSTKTEQVQAEQSSVAPAETTAAFPGPQGGFGGFGGGMGAGPGMGGFGGGMGGPGMGGFGGGMGAGPGMGAGTSHGTVLAASVRQEPISSAETLLQTQRGRTRAFRRHGLLSATTIVFNYFHSR